MKITVATLIPTSREDAWRAWTTPEAITQWNAASEDWCCPRAELDLRPGGAFNYRMEARDGSMGFDFRGSFTRVVPHELLAYEIEDGREVVVEFLAGDEGVTVRETFEAEGEHPPELQRDGWQAILDRFARHVG